MASVEERISELRGDDRVLILLALNDVIGNEGMSREKALALMRAWDAALDVAEAAAARMRLSSYIYTDNAALNAEASLNAALARFAGEPEA